MRRQPWLPLTEQNIRLPPDAPSFSAPSSTASRAAIPTGTTCSRSHVQGGALGLSIIRILALPEEEQDPEWEEEPFLPAPEDTEEGFNIRGIVEPHDGFVEVTVRRKPQGTKQFAPLQLRLEGFLPGAVAGEFWDLLAEREGNKLLLVDGTRLLTAVA